jgi:cell division protein FtsB
MQPEESETAKPDPRPRSRRRLRSAQDTRARRQRILIWGLSIGLCVLLVNALIGENGYLATLRSERENAIAMAALARIRLENRQLQQAAQRLKSDPKAVEEAARRELGMIRPGETVVVVRDAAPPAPPPVK